MISDTMNPAELTHNSAPKRKLCVASWCKGGIETTVRTRPSDYELSEKGKQIIRNAIQRIKNNLDTFQFTIQNRVTPITAGELNNVDSNLRTIRELLNNEKIIAQLHYSYCIENESGNDETGGKQ